MTVLMAFSLHVNAQSIYEIKFSDEDLNYTCLLVYNNENDAYMRIRFTLNGKNRLVETRYKGYSRRTEDGNRSYFQLEGQTVRYISDKLPNEKYNMDYFIWFDNESLPYTTDSTDSKGKLNYKKKVDSYKKLNVNYLNESYLRFFYKPNEKDYLSFLKMTDEFKKKYASINNTNLHLIVVANTKISDIGSGCKADLINLDNEFKSIAKTLNISYNRVLIYGENFTKQNVLNSINTLKVEANDIVVFVYRGHGFRWDDQKSSYPTFDFRIASSTPLNSSNSLLYDDIYWQVVKKGGKLNLILADCCNSYLNRRQVSQDYYLQAQSTVTPDRSKLYSLFMECKGNLAFVAANKGEVSWVDTIRGGFFTNSFLQALLTEISYLTNSEISWANIVNNTAKWARNRSETCITCDKSSCTPPYCNQTGLQSNQILKIK